jgi:hypothetical protein
MSDTAVNRNRRIASSSPIGSVEPSSSTAPPAWRIRLSSLIRLLPNVDFPQPDSPASPMISPSATAKLAPSSAFTSPRRVR